MDGSEIIAEDNDTLQIPSPLSIVAIAINGNRKSKYIVKWALEKFIPEGNNFFKLIHVRARITGIPTPSKCMLLKLCWSQSLYLMGPFFFFLKIFINN